MFDFAACTVEVFDTYVRTTFKLDGRVSWFHPPVHDPDFITAAHYAGYGDPMQHGLEHDVVHAYVADALGWPHSYSVWSDAHAKDRTAIPMAKWSQRVKDEEHLVVSMQRYMNTGQLDPYGKLEAAFGSDLNRHAKALLALLRPWLV
jgi:hypothetical protein